MSDLSDQFADLRDELADLMMRAVHSSYELSPTSPWIKVAEAIQVLISEALARHLREKHREVDESFNARLPSRNQVGKNGTAWGTKRLRPRPLRAGRLDDAVPAK